MEEINNTNNYYTLSNMPRFMLLCQYGTLSEMKECIEYEKPSIKSLYNGLKWTAINGDINKFKYLLQLKDDNNNYKVILNEEIFKLLCTYKQIHIIKYIINTVPNNNNSNINKQNIKFQNNMNLRNIIPECMYIASYTGNYDLLIYLYDVSILYKTIKPNFTQLFVNVCNVGNLKCAKFLMSKHSNTIDIHYSNDYVFHICCHKQYIDIIEYLFELSDNINIQAYKHKVFKVACCKNNIKLATLIKDYNNNKYKNEKNITYDYQLNDDNSRIIKTTIN
jgi:hypothetical protein